MAVAYNPQIVTDGLIFKVDASNVKCYPAGSGTSIKDISNNLSGVLTGATATGGLYSFPGTGDQIRFTTATLPNNSSWSIGAWYKTSQSYAYEAGIITIGYSPNIVIRTSGQLRLWMGNYPTTTYPQVLGTKVVNNGSWHYSVGTWDGITAKLYTDGILENSAAVSSCALYANFDVGFEQNNGYKAFQNGFIASAEVYSRALTAVEVFQNFNATRGRYGL
jgi:hypothetical protein